MRRRAPQLVAIVGAALLLNGTLAGQTTSRPTPAPVVTAESDPWYLAGEPITFSGSFYFPAGPQVYFNPYEMVRTGNHRGVPLYARTTIEPFSKLYVPLAGGLMQPYERRRTGDLVGTVGSTMPSLPTAYPSEENLAAGTTGIAQAASPPTLYTPLAGLEPSVPVDVAPPAAPVPAATTGPAAPEVPRGPLRSARTPEGLNGVYVEYRDRKWFSSGHAVPLDVSRFKRIGEYAGFPVYAERDGDPQTIYVAVRRDAPTLIAPYSARPR